MSQNKGYKLRSTVNVLLLLTVLATLIITSIIAYRNEKQSLTSMTFQLNRVYADKMSDTVNSLFENMKQALAVTGEYLATDLSRADLHEQLVLFQRSNPSFNSVFILDTNGFIIDGSNVEPSSRGKLITTEGTLQALKQQRPLVSEPYMSMTNKLIVMVSNPLRDANGKYIGFIGGSIRLHETNIFQTVLGSTKDQTDGSYAYVVSSSGNLLYHPDQSRIAENVKENEVVQKLMNGFSGNQRIVNTMGLDMLASYAYIKEAGWGIVAQTPTEVVLSSARILVMKIVLYMLPALLIFIAVVYWAVGRISAPLSQLASYASMLSPNQSGANVLPMIHSWNYEANELHKALRRAVRHIRYQFDSLSLEAQTDPLTGLYNRRLMDGLIKSWISQNNSFSILVMDLDKFKQVNDTYGHEMGDAVLKFLSAALQQLLGKEYVSCRFGGEEFVVLVPNEEFEVAVQDAERICKYMSDTVSPTGQRVTLSIGVAHYPSMAHNAEQLFRLADEAMYRAKNHGRNRVEIAHLLIRNTLP